MNPVKGFEAQQVVDKFQHDLLHTKELLEMYTDLSVVTKNTPTSVHEIEYFSPSISSEIDNCDFAKENLSVIISIHVVHPYKKVHLNCSKCDGIVRVNSNPHRIPLFMEQEIEYKKEHIISCFAYEDYFKFYNFNNHVLAESQLYIISKLEELSKNNIKLNLTALSSSIKKLLPFA